ncbi:G2/mitotic-specific cyclin-1 [Taenia solium]|eukprot:TsM_000184800 transcript=TsM_000184800 gene=TsM_000184800
MDDRKKKGCDSTRQNREPEKRCQLKCQGELPSTSRSLCGTSPRGECSTNPCVDQPAGPSNQTNHVEASGVCSVTQAAYPASAQAYFNSRTRPPEAGSSTQAKFNALSNLIRELIAPFKALYLSIERPQNFGLGFYLRRANEPEIEGSEIVPPNEGTQAEIVSRRTGNADCRCHFLDEYNNLRGFSDWVSSAGNFDPLASKCKFYIAQWLLQRLGSDTRRDTELTKAYGCNLPSGSGITASLRATIFDWMTALGELFQIRSQGLHMAAWFVDHTQWSEEPNLRIYILRVLAALMMGDIATVSRTEDEWNCMRHDLIVFAEHNFSLDQVIAEENAILAMFPRPLPYPTPHNFLLPFMMISDDENLPPEFSWGIGLCLYCFDLGLLCDQLIQYSAQFKCAAVVLLFRRIVRSFCQCSAEELNNPCNQCEYHRVSEMTQLLYLQAQENDINLLRSVSNIYAGLLRGVQDFFVRATRLGYENAPPRLEVMIKSKSCQ